MPKRLILNEAQLARLLEVEPLLVTFEKKDGTIREMVASRRRCDILRVGVKGADTRCPPPGIVKVIDLEIDEWRSIRVDSIISIEELDSQEVAIEG